MNRMRKRTPQSTGNAAGARPTGKPWRAGLGLLGCFLWMATARAQPLLDHQLRLEPVWSRVADALREPGSVESAEFSPDGKSIVSGTKYDNSVIMWRTSDGTERWRQYARQEVLQKQEKPGNSNGKKTRTLWPCLPPGHTTT